jgi:hypothetical protein
MKHTPTPWNAEQDRVYSDGRWIASTDCIGADTNTETYQNAAFIVRAVNSHDELVEALKNITNLPNELCCPSVKNFAKEALAKAETEKEN